MRYRGGAGVGSILLAFVVEERRSESVCRGRATEWGGEADVRLSDVEKKGRFGV